MAPTSSHFPRSRSALLIVDVINPLDFEGAEALRPHAIRAVRRIAALAARARKARVPVIFVNDNRGRWRSEFRELVRMSVADSDTGAGIVEQLQPGDDDYSVLKPKHSAFYATPLDLLLRHLRVQRLIVTGVASDQCIVISAAEARMRDYDVVVPRDCVGAPSAARNAAALRQLAESHRIATPLSSRLRLPARAVAGRDGRRGKQGGARRQRGG